MVKDKILFPKAYEFSIRIVNIYKRLTTEKKEFVLSRQLLKSGTSIGANIAEANGAISMADFSAKMSLAYKESLEAMYWLNLLRDTDYLEVAEFNELQIELSEISKILFSILKKTRIES